MDLPAAAYARGVEDDEVGLGDAGAGEDGFDLAVLDADAVEVGEVVAGVLDGSLAGFDAEDGAGVADALGDGAA